MSTEVSAVLENASPPMVFSLLFAANVKEESLPQDPKATSPMEVTPDGMTTEVSGVPEKAPVSMVFRLEFVANVTDERLPQLLKALALILVTLAVMATLVIVELLMNALSEISVTGLPLNESGIVTAVSDPVYDWTESVPSANST